MTTIIELVIQAPAWFIAHPAAQLVFAAATLTAVTVLRTLLREHSDW